EAGFEMPSGPRSTLTDPQNEGEAVTAELEAQDSPSPRGAGWADDASLVTASASSAEPVPDLRDPFEPLVARGISLEVGGARGDIRYSGRPQPGHDRGTIGDALEPYGLIPGQKSTRQKQANDAANEAGELGYGQGLLMPKYPVPGAEPVEPQLRPREP